jgi:hypothetical protein
MAMTATAVRNCKPDSKPIKLFEGGGLFLLAEISGGVQVTARANLHVCSHATPGWPTGRLRVILKTESP